MKRQHLLAGLVGATLVASALPALAEGDCCVPLPAPSAAATVDTLAPAVLTSHRNQRVSLPDGKLWVVTFYYGTCRDVCPTLLYNMGSVSEALAPAVRARVGFAAVTFDPKRDTLEAIAQHAENYEMTGNQFHMLTGDPATIERMTKSFRFSFKPDQGGHFQHTNLMAVMDGSGRVIHHFYGLQPNIERIAATITKAVGN